MRPRSSAVSWRLLSISVPRRARGRLMEGGVGPGCAFRGPRRPDQVGRGRVRAANGTAECHNRGRAAVRWGEERLRALPTGWAWERFASEERRVSWDGYVSY